MPFLFPRSLVCAAPSTQGHMEAAAIIGGIYYWGQGVAVDHKRALAAYKIGVEGGDWILGGLLVVLVAVLVKAVCWACWG